MKNPNCKQCYMSQPWLNKKRAEGLFQEKYYDTPCKHHKTLITKEILNSLETAKMLGAGQPLRILAKVGYGHISETSIEETKKFLRLLKRQNKVYYVHTTKVWVLK